jgi:hypothetical protein
MKNPARKKIRPMLSSFVDGELSPRERMFVERHLESCEESAREVDDIRAVSTLVRTTMEEAAKQEDWTGFADKVMGCLPPERLPFWRRFHIQFGEVFTYQRSWVLAGSAAAVLLCLSVFMWTSSAEPTGYASPHLSIKTVSAKGGAALKTIVTHTETGDAIVWVVEETPAPGGEGVDSVGENGKTPPPKLNSAPQKTGAL